MNGVFSGPAAAAAGLNLTALAHWNKMGTKLLQTRRFNRFQIPGRSDAAMHDWRGSLEIERTRTTTLVITFSGPDLNDVIIGVTIFAVIALSLRRENPHWPWPHILFRAFLVCVVGAAKVCFAFWILDPIKHSVDVNVFDPMFRRIPEWIQIVGFASLLVGYAWMVSYGLWKRRETEKRGRDDSRGGLRFILAIFRMRWRRMSGDLYCDQVPFLNRTLSGRSITWRVLLSGTGWL